MLGCKTSGRINDEPLTQATFVESLLQMISKDPESERDLLKRKSLSGKVKFLEHTDVIWNYFAAIKKKWPNAWDDVSNSLLSKNNCFRALMRYLRDLYPEVRNSKLSVDDFYKYFEKLEITDEDFNTSKGLFPRGDGGMSKFYKYLSGQITYEKLKNFD